MTNSQTSPFPLRLWPWVEGKGDQEAIPTLIRRLRPSWVPIRPIQVGGLKALTKKSDRYVKYLKTRPNVDAVLILLDLDDGCPVDEARTLTQKLQALNPTKPMAVIFAVREYEAWFLAADPERFPSDPEQPRDAKGSVRRCGIQPNYAPTVHQKLLTKSMDLATAQRRSRSFRRLLHALDELEKAVQQHTIVVTPALIKR